MTNTSPVQYDVFVSYSRKDADKVKRVVDELRSSGLKVWFDQHEIGLGERIRKRVFEDGISASAVVLVCISRNSLASEFVANEIDAAMWRELNTKRVIVVPALLGSVRTSELPQDLQGKAYFDLRYNFDAKWLEHKSRLTIELTALIRGEARRGSEITLRVGDPLVRFFNNYSFNYENETGGGNLTEHEVNVIALSIAQVALAPEFVEDDAGIHDNEENEEGAARLSDPGKAFIQRYGEYSLRQIALYVIDVSGLSLAGGFQMEEMGDVMFKVRIIVVLFSLYIAFEKAKGAPVPLLVVTFDGTDIKAGVVGEYV